MESFIQPLVRSLPTLQLMRSSRNKSIPWTKTPAIELNALPITDCSLLEVAIVESCSMALLTVLLTRQQATARSRAANRRQVALAALAALEAAVVAPASTTSRPAGGCTRPCWRPQQPPACVSHAHPPGGCAGRPSPAVEQTPGQT